MPSCGWSETRRNYNYKLPFYPTTPWWFWPEQKSGVLSVACLSADGPREGAALQLPLSGLNTFSGPHRSQSLTCGKPVLLGRVPLGTPRSGEAGCRPAAAQCGDANHASKLSDGAFFTCNWAVDMIYISRVSGRSAARMVNLRCNPLAFQISVEPGRAPKEGYAFGFDSAWAAGTLRRRSGCKGRAFY